MSDGKATRQRGNAARRAGGSRRILATLFGTLVLAPGCARELVVCPFHDEFVVHPVTATTASAEGVHAANVAASLRVRNHTPKEIRPFDGSVTHGPLYFEDPFEESGSEDGKFAWTGEDHLQWWYWRGRFLVNEILWPVSVVVTPPWQVMASDGRPSRTVFFSQHDAAPVERQAAPAASQTASEQGG